MNLSALTALNDNADPLLREAADWFVRVQGEEVTTDDLTEWQQWLSLSPRHREAFQQVEDFWECAGRLESPPWPSSSELTLETGFASQASCPVAATPHDKLSRRRWRAVGIAASACAVAASAAFVWLQPLTGDARQVGDAAAIKTLAAEQRTLSLSDGSTVVLGAQSRVTVQFTPTARNLVIDAGEAYFQVARDITRPFAVRAGNGTITAIGTAFNVHNLQGRVVVTVVEGTVDVTDIRSPASTNGPRIDRATTRVKAGHEIAYGSAPVPMQAVDTSIATAWRNGRLKYHSEPLKFVVPDIARYTERQLVIADPEVGELQYTGTVMPGEVDDWLASVADVFPVDIVRLNADTVLLKARNAVP